MRIPSTSNTRQSGYAGGTMGGPSLMGNQPRSKVGTKPGRKQLLLGDEVYLWILVLIEVFLIGFLRQKTRRHHGG